MYKVMLADDEPIMRKALLTLTNWKNVGCEVVYTASNGQEVLQNLESAAPDILITDIRMPGQDGIAIAKYIWEERLPIKVIILTAYADFSYAQSAVKYKVVDYVTKTGAFEGLLAAIEKAIGEIEKEQKKTQPGNPEIAVKNLLKSVFDGSLYDTETVEEEAKKIGIQLEQFTIVLLQYRIGKEQERRKTREIYQSLENFFAMVFAGQMLSAVPVERDMFAIVIVHQKESNENWILKQCMQMIDMMDNFMHLFTYIGIGECHNGISELKQAYNEAQRAIGYSFITKESKIHFYQEVKNANEKYTKGEEHLAEQICAEVRKGNAAAALELFTNLLEIQKSNRYSGYMIKSMGILIQSRCREVLEEYDKTIYEVTGIKESISKAIYYCRFVDEYERLLQQIISETAQAVHVVSNRKQSIVAECQKYVEEHFEENIQVNDIAREIGSSISYLSRIFKEQTGRTIIYTLNQKKLSKAKEYLTCTDMKVYEIAEKLGFENSTYFSHFFKKYEGVSPKEYKGEMTDGVD